MKTFDRICLGFFEGVVLMTVSRLLEGILGEISIFIINILLTIIVLFVTLFFAKKDDKQNLSTVQGHKVNLNDVHIESYVHGKDVNIKIACNSCNHTSEEITEIKNAFYDFYSVFTDVKSSKELNNN